MENRNYFRGKIWHSAAGLRGQMKGEEEGEVKEIERGRGNGEWGEEFEERGGGGEEREVEEREMEEWAGEDKCTLKWG